VELQLPACPFNGVAVQPLSVLALHQLVLIRCNYLDTVAPLGYGPLHMGASGWAPAELLQAGLNDALPCAGLEHGRVIDVGLMLRPPIFPFSTPTKCSTGWWRSGDRTEACIALDETQKASELVVHESQYAC
jgi:hypothetical protein